MIKTIVVDDEKIIRLGIASFINNSDTGFEVSGTFKDGSEAIEYIDTHDVDLVISDIKMVDISGIELAKYIYENKPQIKVILISGYSEFEYAKAAIKYNVKEYISKPTNFKELENVLMKVRSELTAESDHITEFLDNIKQLYAAILSADKPYSLDTLRELLGGNTHTEQLGQYAANIFEIVCDRLYSNMKIQLDQDKYGYKRLAEYSDPDSVYEHSSMLITQIINQIPAKGNKTSSVVADKLIQFVNEHFSENISLQDAADTVFFTPVYCSRFFKKHMGKNFTDYLLQVRMEHAALLLKENKRITEISKACGYSSPGYFTRIFKEYYNCTPSEFLRNQ